MPTPNFDPTELHDAAHKVAVIASPASATNFLLETVGARVTAAALGLADARPLYKWRTGAEMKAHDAELRLRILHRIVWEITEAYGPRVASAFLRSSNPQLDDQAPLTVLATGNPLETEPRLAAAARALLEG